ncbi:MAG: 3-oxoacid CoA-transferase subunit B [Burkholderiales bacterium]|nr:3-oxoacid CoA-transferase subunit B [Burkholderiales bacterium]
MQARNRQAIAARAASDIVEGWCVNLGIGIPTMVADAIPSGREVLIQSENGILGMGPAQVGDTIDPWVVNAGKQYVTLLPGASLFHHADSFAMIRGGHLDLCLLGAFEVASNGDVANWSMSSADRAPAVGGAMDLAVGARRLWSLMDHCARDGRPKLVERCTLPLTAQGAVSRVYTDLAVLAVGPAGFEVLEMVPGLTRERLCELTGAPLAFAPGV